MNAFQKLVEILDVQFTFIRTAPDGQHTIASIPDRHARYGTRYGNGTHPADALADLVVNLGNLGEDPFAAAEEGE